MTPATTEQHFIRIRGLIKDFGRFRLGPVDLDLPVGYVTGLVGINGAGKTTLIKALLGLVRPDAGTISGDGFAATLARDDVGVVFDRSTLIPEWNLSQAASALRRFAPRWDDSLFRSLIDRFGLSGGLRIATLSRGETTKAHLALALARRPRLLILDEPTSGLDPAARRATLDLFREYMAADEEHTIVFSTHITSDLERIADQLCVIGAGTIVDTGATFDLIERYALVRGPSAALATGRSAVHGLRENGETFEGLIRTSDTPLFGPDVLIEPTSIDDLVVHLGQGVES